MSMIIKVTEGINPKVETQFRPQSNENTPLGQKVMAGAALTRALIEGRSLAFLEDILIKCGANFSASAPEPSIPVAEPVPVDGNQPSVPPIPEVLESDSTETPATPAPMEPTPEPSKKGKK